MLGLAGLAYGAVVPAVPVAVPAKLEELDTEPQYTFSYDVQDTITGDSKAQFETRTGDVVRGSYSLIDADGARRIVEYTADPVNGFNAVVSRQPIVLASSVAAAAPLAPISPVVPAVAAAAPAPVPAIPESGPDSDVEVVEARSGPVRQKPSRETEAENFQRLRQSQKYQQKQQVQQQQQQEFQGYPRQNPSQQQQFQDEQQSQQLRSQPQRARIPQVTAARLTYPAVSAYTTSFTSPVAFAPVGNLVYTQTFA
ncbi:cuticle protein 18.6-like [Prorops nasuta]|uniref:cuticle protein 18.6-like n=1 Tax=Prorops nasuta TaxID=863751 RepID=UPI0034CF5B53